MRFTLAAICARGRRTAILRALVCSFAVVILSVCLVGALFELLEGGSLQTFEYTAIIQCASTGQNDRAIFVSRTIADGAQPTRYSLWLYDPHRAQRPIPLPWTQSSPSCVACIPDSQRIVVGGWDGAIHLTTLAQESAPRCLGRHLDGGMMSLKCSPDKRFLASRTSGSLRAWDLSSGKLLWEKPAGDITCHAIDPQSKSVVCGRYDGSIEEWNFESGASMGTAAVQGNGVAVCNIDFHPDGRLLAMLASGEAHVLSRPWGNDHEWLSEKVPWRSGWALRSSFSPDGCFLVTTSKFSQSLLNVWDARSNRWLGRLQGHRQYVLGAAFSSERRLLSWSADGTVHVWDVAAQRLLDVITLPSSRG